MKNLLTKAIVVSRSRAAAASPRATSLRFEALESRELLDAANLFPPASSPTSCLSSQLVLEDSPIDLSSTELLSTGNAEAPVLSSFDDILFFSVEGTVAAQNAPADDTPIVSLDSSDEENELIDVAPNATTRTVTSLSDSITNHGSLRYLISVSNAGDTIKFDSSLKGKTITLGGSHLSISKSITIDASDLADESTPGITISANNRSRVFYVGANINVSFKGLGVVNGKEQYGGGVEIYKGSATFTNCLIKGNTSIAGGAGGGVLVGNSGRGTFVNCTISENASLGENAGGGVYVHGTGTFTNCTVNGNSAYRGGGVYFRGNGESTGSVTDCAFIGNSSRYDGGGVFIGGTERLVGCTITDNTASHAGGGVYLLGDSTGTFTNCAISGNSAEVDGGGLCVAGNGTFTDCSIVGNSAESGGGARSYVMGTVSFSNSVISENTADFGGGARLEGNGTFTDCVINDNTADKNGAGVRIDVASTGTFTNCVINKNFAGESCGGAFVIGTGILTNCLIAENTVNEAGAGVAILGTVRLYSCTIAANSAATGGGCSIYKSPNVETEPKLFAYNSIIAGNSSENGTDDVRRRDAETELYAYNSLSTFADWDDGDSNYVYVPSQPLFTDAENREFKLARYSQAVNKGNNNYVSTDLDLAGEERVQVETVDLGAFESPYDGLEAPSLVVTTEVDEINPYDSQVSLREAIAYAKANPDVAESASYTVTFADGLETVAVTAGELTVDESLSFVGAVEVSANGASRVFNIVGSENTLDVTIKGLTIANGKTASQESGAGVYVDNANLTLENATFTGNASGYDGGAIYLNAGSLSATGSAFDGNTADHAGGAIAIYTTEATEATNVSATISNSTFTDNQASRGGAAYVKLGAMSISESSFTHNDANLYLGSNYGGAVYYGSASGSIVRSSFENNWSIKDGGAVYAYDSSLVVYGTFTGNSAARGGAYFQSKGNVEISGGEFLGNNATGEGGAIFTGNGAITTISDDATFENNRSTNGLGGAISVDKSEATIENASFASNSAKTGGAIYQKGGYVIATNAEFSENQATQSGGAVYVDKGIATFNGSTFDSNKAGGYGGAVYGGAASEIALEGGSLANNESTKAGGAVFVFGGKLTTSNGTAFNANASGTYGGAIALSAQGEAEFVGVVLTNNTTNGKLGGAVYAIDSSATFKGFTATNNAAKSGAAIYGYNSSINALNGTVSNNNATETTGGAISVSYSTLTVTNGTYESNSAATLGGAIMSYASTAMISGAAFTGNGADSGAAVAATGDGTLYVYDSAFDGNTATTNGGAAYVSDADLTVIGTSFTNNEATNAGGVFVRKGDAQLSRSIFTGNTATNYGAGLYLANDATVALVENCLFAENNATKGGSGLYSSYARFTLTNCTIAANEGATAVRSLNSDAKIVNSIIARNAEADVFMRGGIKANYVLSAFADWTSGDNNIEDDDSELFAEGGYELVAGSLAVDAGDNGATSSGSDLAGRDRIVNGIVDLGAYELQTTSSNALFDTALDEFDEEFALNWLDD